MKRVSFLDREFYAALSIYGFTYVIEAACKYLDLYLWVCTEIGTALNTIMNK